MKLNLGSGDQHIEGFTNVDLHYPADIRDDMRKLSKIQDNSVDEIYIGHALMYLSKYDRMDCMRACARVLKHKGILYIEEPIQTEDWEYSKPTSAEDIADLMRHVWLISIQQVERLPYSRHKNGNVVTMKGEKW